MLAKGYVDSVDEAFDIWIGDGRPYVENEQPSIQDAVTLVRNSEVLPHLLIQLTMVLRQRNCCHT